jgi:hypothetical protein
MDGDMGKQVALLKSRPKILKSRTIIRKYFLDYNRGAKSGKGDENEGGFSFGKTGAEAGVGYVSALA